MKMNSFAKKQLPINLQFFAERPEGADNKGADADAPSGGPAEDSGADETDDGQEEKKFSQKDVDEAVKNRLARERRKWQREQQKNGSTAGTGGEDTEKDQSAEDEKETDRKARKAEEKAAALEMKWTCLEHDVKKNCVDDVLALAKVHLEKGEDADIEDAIDAVLKKYPQFKEGHEASGEEGGAEKKGWGQRHGTPQKKEPTVEDEIRKQMFGK